MIDGFNISRVHQHITHGSHLHKIPRKTLHLKIYNIIHKKLEKSPQDRLFKKSLLDPESNIEDKAI